ncbi:MAG: response regulator, partial [Gorillibacterium sp.]|nr:response regulator [Gorillibacterium sp.]
MYRVLIVDDEPEIRLGLRLKADWESIQLMVVGEAGNGIEALEWLANEAIDIVITDMNMPLMDGVSFLDQCHEHYPYLKMIVITGYEDFDYARAAIRSQARDYLLKPISSEELMAILGKVSRELDQERNNHNQLATTKWRLSQYYKEMKEHFIGHIVKEELEYASANLERAKLLQMEEWNEIDIRFVTVGLRERSGCNLPTERTPGKLRLPFEMICREFAEKNTNRCQVFRDANYPGLIHYILSEKEINITAFTTDLQDCIVNYLDFEPVLGLSQVVTGFKEWKEAYISSLLAWNLSESDKLSPV